MYEQKGSYFTQLPRDITNSIYPFVVHTIEQARETDDFICLLQSPEPYDDKITRCRAYIESHSYDLNRSLRPYNFPLISQQKSLTRISKFLRFYLNLEPMLIKHLVIWMIIRLLW